MKGLIIKDPWIKKILNGEKTWEIRGSNTKMRGTIALIQSGTGKIYGSVDLVDTKEIMSLDEFDATEDKHCVNTPIFNYDHVWAWIFENPVRHAEPIPYKHPQGAVIWVNLDKEETA